MKTTIRNSDKENFFSKTAYCLLLCISFPASLFSQTLALPNDDLLVVKQFINGKFESYVTASWNEEEGCNLRLFEVLDALQFKYAAQWEKYIFTGYITPDSHFRVAGDTLYNNSGETWFPQKKARWSPSGDLYASPDFFRKVYQIEVRFSMNELAVYLATQHSEAYRLNRERIRKQAFIKQRKEASILTNVDTLSRANLKLNDLTYAISQSKSAGAYLNNYNYNVQGRLRGEMLTGIFYLRYNYGSHNRSNNIQDNLKFNWEKFDVKSKYVKSIVVNHDYPSLITSTYGYSGNLTISNSSKPTNLGQTRQYIGRTFPNSNVEIYNNGQLIDYATSDSLGNFRTTVASARTDNSLKAVVLNSLGVPSAEVPLVYMPHRAVGKGQLIYRFTTGITDYGDLFFAPTLDYGLSSWIVLSAGNETVVHWGDNLFYRPQSTTSAAIIGANLTDKARRTLEIKYLPFQLLCMRYNGSHAGIRANVFYEHRNEHQTISNSVIKDMLQLGISGNLPKLLNGNYSLGFNYYNYHRDLGFIQSPYLQVNLWKRNITGSFSMNSTSNSFHLKPLVLTTRVGYYFKNSWYNEMLLEYSTGMRNGFRLGNRLNLQFKNKLTAFVDASYQVKGVQKYLNAGINWRLPFLQLNAGSYSSPRNTNIYMQANGSMLFQGGNVGFSHMASTSSALRVALFVDVNGNGVKDDNEPFVKKPEMKLSIATVKSEMSNGILFTNILPNKPFSLSIPQQKLGDISWQIDDCRMNLMLYPHQCRTIYVPVKVLTEIAGQVNMTNRRNNTGMKNVKVVITNKETGNQIILTTDESGGYIYMGLTCGSYTIDLHPDILQQLKLKKTDPDKVYNLDIEPSIEGKQLDGFDFYLSTSLPPEVKSSFPQ